MCGDALVAMKTTRFAMAALHHIDSVGTTLVVARDAIQ